jgi:hypothetical protein
MSEKVVEMHCTFIKEAVLSLIESFGESITQEYGLFFRGR